MSRELKTNLNGPVVRLTDKEGSKFVGFIAGKNDTKFGEAIKFSVVDGDASVKIKDDKGNLVEAAVAVGDTVTVFASGQLKDKLGLAKPGEKIEIVYHGKKLNPKSGRRFNDYTVSVLD